MAKLPLFLALFLSSLLILTTITSSSHARSLPNAAAGETQAGGSAAGSIAAAAEWMDGLMGMAEEKCESESTGEGEEEECVKRRAVSEAHLDYIYTQNQPPH